jgi:hypothetical protein
MSNTVFANGREVACKASSGKSVCSFPDVCFTPPQTPATPPGVPVPYPNTGFSSDTTDGSRSVKIDGQEVMLKDKSHFKTSTGDEAGCAPKKGLVNSKITGKVFFVSWSMNVQIESENVVRHLDQTTHNHGSNPNDPAPWMFIAAQAFEEGGPCHGQEHLRMTPYKAGCPEVNGKKQTPHHLLPDRTMTGKTNYSHAAAPCICVNGRTQHMEVHKECHKIFDPVERYFGEKGRSAEWDYGTGRAAAVDSAAGALNPPGRPMTDGECKCVSAQLDAYYKKADNGPKMDDGQTLNSPQGQSGKAGGHETYETVATSLDKLTGW